MFVSVVTVSFVGNAFALRAEPWYLPRTFIPSYGMLLVNTIAVGTTHFMKQLRENKDIYEMYLSFGASRWEAARPLIKDSLRIALLPILNTMSIVGLISIPGMMTGQILGGAPIGEAVRYQQIILFLITASATLSALISVIACFLVCFDQESRLRLERIEH
ncbi:hypothetical protein HK096_008651, partial [Nowakowskiella sp. JEL0078]